jgi:hypothetical protein
VIFTYHGTLGGQPSLGQMPYGWRGILSTNTLNKQILIGFRPIPVFTNITATATSLSFAGTNATAGSNYIVLSSTNVALPLTNWTPVVTQQFTAPHFTFSLTNGAVGSAKFFRLKLP